MHSALIRGGLDGRIIMISLMAASEKPQITVCESDYDRLTTLAEAAEHSRPEIAEFLLGEMNRAVVVADEALPAQVVRMHAEARIRTETGAERTLHLVYPAEANVSEHRISILSPIGAALIGLQEGQSIEWTGANGGTHRLSVLTVRPPA